jgi:hypothetical protein
MNSAFSDANDAPPSAPTSHRFTLSRDEYGRLVLTDAAGVRHVGVEPVRAFPLSDPDRWIALVDAQGHELATIASPTELSDELRRSLEDELARREFLPVIQRIIDVTLGREPTEWTVDTNRGRTKFLIDGADAVRRLDGERCLVVDTHGVRFLIDDRTRLDAFSRRLLEHYL